MISDELHAWLWADDSYYLTLFSGAEFGFRCFKLMAYLVLLELVFESTPMCYLLSNLHWQNSDGLKRHTPSILPRLLCVNRG